MLGPDTSSSYRGNVHTDCLHHMPHCGAPQQQLPPAGHCNKQQTVRQMAAHVLTQAEAGQPVHAVQHADQAPR